MDLCCNLLQVFRFVISCYLYSIFIEEAYLYNKCYFATNTKLSFSFKCIVFISSRCLFRTPIISICGFCLLIFSEYVNKKLLYLFCQWKILIPWFLRLLKILLASILRYRILYSIEKVLLIFSNLTSISWAWSSMMACCSFKEFSNSLFLSNNVFPNSAASWRSEKEKHRLINGNDENEKKTYKFSHFNVNPTILR